MVVVEVIGEDPSEVALVENDAVIKALASNRSDESLHIRILPWRSWRHDYYFDTHALDALAEVPAVDAVAVSDQEARGFVIRKGFNELLSRPLGRRICCYVEVDDHAAVMAKHQEAKQDAKRRGRHSEEIDCHNVTNVVVQESCPSQKLDPATIQPFGDSGTGRSQMSDTWCSATMALCRNESARFEVQARTLALGGAGRAIRVFAQAARRYRWCNPPT